MITRRQWLAGVPALGLAQTAPTTVTYKRAGSLEIQADVHKGRPGAPLIFWIHGGALISGSRQGLRAAHRDRYLAAGYSIVSVDYRLAPEAKLPAILDDLRDAWRWARTAGATTFGYDPHRVAVIGHSAGGYLTLTAGYWLRPRPTALVSYYGYGDIAGDWYAKPDPFYSKQPAVPRQEAYAAVGGPAMSSPPPKNSRGRFYLYCRQNGLWPREVAGLDPVQQRQQIDRYCPLRHVDPHYPPTLLLHGDADTDVPFEQSALMDAELTRNKVEHDFIRIPGGPHGFDGRVNDPVVAKSFERVLDFLSKKLA